MICNNCKREINENELYCQYCGCKIKKMKRSGKKLPVSTIISSCIAIVLALGLAFSLLYRGGLLVIPGIGNTKNLADMDFSEQKYFPEPEAAADYFTKCISKNNFRGALMAFAVKDQVDNYDFIKQAERLGAYNPLNSMAPNYPEYAVLNKIFLYNQAARGIQNFAFSFNYKEDLQETLVLNNNPDYDASSIYKTLNPAEIKNLKLSRIDYTNPDIQDSEVHQENMKKLCNIYGFTSIKEYYALYELNGQYFLGSFQFVEYAKGWQIYSLRGLIGDTSSNGNIISTNMDEYLGMVEK